MQVCRTGNIKAEKFFIEEASMHSELVAGDSIIIKGGRGELSVERQLPEK
ncbi:MAG: hypothetical protein IPJ60_19270 [Sphingobacteriaceae bacterium]|nr:hypothetical protein [Sphingobacteriaceae bacterium]